MSTNTAPPARLPTSLFALAIFYGGMVCIAGVLGNKQVTLGPLSDIGPLVGLPHLAVEAGIFAFLLLVALSSAVAEMHGRALANKLVLIGFAPLIFSMFLSFIVSSLPASPEMAPENLTAIQTVLYGNLRLWGGGIIAYGVSQTLNVTIFAWLKGHSGGGGGGGGLLWLRAALAGVLSQIIDTLIFVTVAFYGVFPIGGLLAGQMLAKVVLSALLVPPLIYLIVALGRRLDRGALSQ